VGYERKSLQILGGGFSCLPPVDKVPITDYLLAQNWRVDSLGLLVSRAGYVSKFAIAGAGVAHSAANMGGSMDPYYVGANDGIAAPTGSLYYDGSQIATGCDGNRIGFAAQNGYMWTMNRARQGRHSPGPGWETWNLTPPPASPTVATGATGSPVGSATYTYPFQGESIAANIAVGLQTVTPGSMGTIAVGTRLGFGTNSSDYEIVSVIAVTGATFDAVFTRAHAGPSLAAYYDYVHSLTIAGVTYSFIQNGYSDAQIPLVIAGLAGSDPNCTVTYVGTGQDVVITPIVVNTLIPITGSDGNAPANLANGAITSLPNGTYQFYLTFQSADLSLESNPGPVSLPVVAASEAIDVTIPAADAPVDPRIGFVNIYATGGTLGAPYRVGQVASTVASPATIFSDTIPDLQATDNGVTMPTTNDPPPAASGMIGPWFTRLLAWSTAQHPNRLFYTDFGLPQYWPGSADNQVGNWVDVGLDGEGIVWCTIHTNLVVIYKERSIWMLILDTSGQTLGSIQQVYDGVGLTGQFALAAAGLIDYFVGPNGLYVFDMDKVHEVAGAVLPIFNQSLTNAGHMTPPGSVLPGSAFNSRSTSPYAVALGHALGKLYVSYAEQGSSVWNLLVYAEGTEPELAIYTAQKPGRWFYHRNAIPGALGFFGFFFDGTAMLGLTGTSAGAQGFNLDDFRGFLTTDAGALIECVYQSHYENCGAPENQKVYLEVAIDYELPAGSSANVYAGFDAGNTALAVIGNLIAGPRATLSFPFPNAVDGGVLAKNISVAIDTANAGKMTLHNVYIYYYVEERLAIVASTLPTDLGVGKVKECKELELDVDASLGAVAVSILSDLPGNAIAVRQSPTVERAGRAIVKSPFAITRGFLWQILLQAQLTQPFRLYSARLLMRVLGVFVEAYESAAGFVWDSMQIALGNGEVSTLDQLRFEMDSDGASSVELFTDLPGENSVSRGTFALTSAATTRHWVTVPLPEGIEARSVDVQTTGPAGYRLYKAQVRHSRIGRFLMGTAPDGLPDAFNTLEFDFQTERRMMFKRLEVDLRADAVVNLSVITDQDGDKIAEIYTPTIHTPNGRTAVLIPMVPGVRGRLLRLKLSGPSPARIYRIRVWTRPVNEPAAAWKWEEFPLEASDIVPTWMDLVVEETPPTWQWVDLDMTVKE
jgi:hypothetical protein